MDVVAKVCWNLLHRLLKQGLQLCFRQLNTHSGFEPADPSPRAPEAAIPCAVIRLEGSPWKQNVDSLQPWHLEPSGQNADDACGYSVEIDCLVEKVFALVISAPPETIREEGHLRSIGQNFFRQKIAPQYWRYAQGG